MDEPQSDAGTTLVNGGGNDSDRSDEDFEFDNAEFQPEVYPTERHDEYWDELDDYSPWREFDTGGMWCSNFV